VTDPIALSGAPGSPYTRKMLGVLRYRRIPYRFLPPSGPALAGLPQPKVPLLPTFYLPDEAGALQAVTDSTPIIRRLEREHAGRSVIPSDPALAFLDELIEDYADEWLTKAMFHYRWSYEADIAKGAAILPCWRGFTIPDEELAARGAMVSERQIGRLRYVGSNAVTGPVIEASYRRFLTAFEAHLRRLPYLLGERPSACDFAVFGQLTQLAEFDPTPMALTLETAPRVTAWVGQQLINRAGSDSRRNRRCTAAIALANHRHGASRVIAIPIATSTTSSPPAPAHIPPTSVGSTSDPSALAIRTMIGNTINPETAPMTLTAPSAVAVRVIEKPATVIIRRCTPAPMALPPGSRWLAALPASCAAAMSDRLSVLRMIRCSSQLANNCTATAVTMASSHQGESLSASPSSL